MNRSIYAREMFTSNETMTDATIHSATLCARCFNELRISTCSRCMTSETGDGRENVAEEYLEMDKKIVLEVVFIGTRKRLNTHR